MQVAVAVMKKMAMDPNQTVDEVGDEMAERLLHKWEIGDPACHNGILLTLATHDRYVSLLVCLLCVQGACPHDKSHMTRAHRKLLGTKLARTIPCSWARLAWAKRPFGGLINHHIAANVLKAPKRGGAAQV